VEAGGPSCLVAVVVEGPGTGAGAGARARAGAAGAAWAATAKGSDEDARRVRPAAAGQARQAAARRRRARMGGRRPVFFFVCVCVCVRRRLEGAQCDTSAARGEATGPRVVPRGGAEPPPPEIAVSDGCAPPVAGATRKKPSGRGVAVETDLSFLKTEK